MSIKKYRLYLIVIVIAVVILGAVMLVQASKEDTTYTDGMMVQRECMVEEAYL